MEYYLKNKFISIIVFSFLVLFSCKNDKKVVKKSIEKKVEYEMYQPSEMAGLMNAMYVYNQQLKRQIVAGETPNTLPFDLMKLHSAEMSNGKGRTPVWNSVVDVFIDSQKAVADTLSNLELKERYNSAINNCLACHKTECVGPIPKIKKLLIK
jgi:hypothetical protein